MENIWKGLIGLFVFLLGLALWIAGSIFEGFTRGLAGESFLLTRGVMSIGFFLIFLGPILFWIILPLKDRWYKSHPKRFIAVVIPLILFLLLIFGVVISEIIHEPQLPTYSFNTTVEGNKLIVDIQRISSGDLPDRLTIRLFNPDGEQVDFDYVSDSDLKDGKERVELSMAFGAPKVGNYTLVIKNIREEVIYQKNFEITPKIIHLGEKIEVGNFSIVFESVETAKSYKWHDADPGYKLVIIKAKVKNKGIEEESPWIGEEVLEVDKGYRYEPEFDFYFNSLRPEEEKTDEAVFEILEETEPTKLYAEIEDVNIVLLLRR